jgi:hypothetical protein
MIEKISRSPAHTWPRTLLLGLLGWTSYAVLYAAILRLQSSVPFLYALAGSLVSHYCIRVTPGTYATEVWESSRID